MSTTLITHAIAALAAAGAVWVFQDARWAADVADIRLEQANDRERANSELRTRQRDITTRYEGALNEARTREASLRRDRSAAAAESDGLRAQLSDTARRIAAAPPAAVAEYATATGELLADCSRSYQELAEKADGHAADVRTLVEAWPR